jgi:hypothetical protein
MERDVKQMTTEELIEAVKRAHEEVEGTDGMLPALEAGHYLLELRRRVEAGEA